MDPSQVAEYYNKHFPAVEVCELFRRQWRGTDCLSTRELCIENVEGKYIRFLEADSAQQLKQLFVKKRVEKFHTGAVYDVSPSLRWKNATLTPRQRELVFDIDLDDYGLDKDDIHECDRGWPLVAVGFRLIAHCLKHHFGFKHTLLVYSGRRGAHLTVYDARACALTEEQRSAIVSWLQPAQRKGQKRVAYRYILQSPSFAALFDSFVLPFWKNFCLRPRCEGGMGALDTLVDQCVFMDTLANEYARKTVRLTGLSGADAWEELTRFAKRSKFKEEATWALKEAVMEFVWPKLDAKVTMQVTHLSKCVLSLHPKTGRLCVPVTDDPLDFKPEQCATLSAVVSGGALEKMEEARIALAKFTARLAKSETETWQPPKLDIVPPAVYNMTGQKRCMDEVHFAEVDRLSAGLVRVFSMVCASSEPDKVMVYFHTEICEGGVQAIPAGYSLPWRSGKYPAERFSRSWEDALDRPGFEVECCRAFVLLLFRRGMARKECEKRLFRMADGLLRPQLLCTANVNWGRNAAMGMFRAQIKEAWWVRQIQLG